MRNIFVLIAFLSVLACCSCDMKSGYRKVPEPHEYNEDTDIIRMEYASAYRSNIIFDDVVRFFVRYNSEHPDWFNTESGERELAIAFEMKCFMDIGFFAKLCGYRQQRSTGNGFIRDSGRILSERISFGDDDSEVRCFQFGITIPVLSADTLSDLHEIDAYYEIVSRIPMGRDFSQPHFDGKSDIDAIGKCKRLPEGKGVYLGTFLIK